MDPERRASKFSDCVCIKLLECGRLCGSTYTRTSSMPDHRGPIFRFPRAVTYPIVRMKSRKLQNKYCFVNKRDVRHESNNYDAGARPLFSVGARSGLSREQEDSDFSCWDGHLMPFKSPPRQNGLSCRMNPASGVDWRLPRSAESLPSIEDCLTVCAASCGQCNLIVSRL